MSPLPGPGPVQAGQRHLRPPGGGRSAEPGGDAGLRRGSGRGRRRAPRRRRVRRPAPPVQARAGARDGGADPSCDHPAPVLLAGSALRGRRLDRDRADRRPEQDGHPGAVGGGPRLLRGQGAGEGPDPGLQAGRRRAGTAGGRDELDSAYPADPGRGAVPPVRPADSLARQRRFLRLRQRRRAVLRGPAADGRRGRAVAGARLAGSGRRALRRHARDRSVGVEAGARDARAGRAVAVRPPRAPVRSISRV